MVGQRLMHLVPIRSYLYFRKNRLSLFQHKRLKRLLTGMRLQGGRALTDLRLKRVAQLNTIVYLKTKFSLDNPTGLGQLVKIIIQAGRHSQRIRMNQVVGYMQMQVIRILMNPAQTLVFLQAKGFSHDVFYPAKRFRCQPGFVFGPETYHQVIGLITFSTGVHGLGGLNFNQGQIIVRRKAALMPRRQAFFTFMTGITNVVAKVIVAVVSLIPLGILSSIDALGYHGRLPRLKASATTRQ